MIKQRLISIDLLKCFSAFLVVCHHFGTNAIFSPEITQLAVPLFMMISFYFLNQSYEKGLDFTKRIKTLVIPLVGWSVIYAILYVFVLNRLISFKDFFWQSTTGHSEVLNPTMWFQSNLIVLTFLFVALKKWYKGSVIALSLFIMMGVYLMQYLNIDDYLFNRFGYEVKYPLRRMFEMVPFVILGGWLYQNKFFVSKKKISYLILSLVCLGVYFGTSLSVPPEDYKYTGIPLFLVSLAFITSFTFIPFDRLPNKMQSVLGVLTKYTLGIYCIHRLIEAFLHPLFEHFGMLGSTLACLGIYMVSYLVCWGMSKIPLNLIKKLI